MKVLNSIPLETKHFLQGSDEESQAYRFFSQSSHGKISFHKKKIQNRKRRSSRFLKKYAFPYCFGALKRLKRLKSMPGALKRLNSDLPSCLSGGVSSANRQSQVGLAAVFVHFAHLWLFAIPQFLKPCFLMSFVSVARGCGFSLVLSFYSAFKSSVSFGLGMGRLRSLWAEYSEVLPAFSCPSLTQRGSYPQHNETHRTTIRLFRLRVADEVSHLARGDKR